MLGLRTRFAFPNLIEQALDHDLEPRTANPSREEIINRFPMLTLDWEGQERIIRSRFDERITPNGPDGWRSAAYKPNLWEYTPTLPEPYDTVVKAAVFAVSRDFMGEIHSNTRRAWAVFNSQRNLGASNLSELCWEPGIEHVWLAFYLLGDCAFDSETKWFVRGPKKTILQYAMAYKFWGHQTGDSMISKCARLNRLRRWNKAWDNPTRDKAEIDAFLDALEAHDQLYLDNRHEEPVEVSISDFKE